MAYAILGNIFIIYIINPSVSKVSITFNFVSWFCIIYLIGIFIRLHGEQMEFLTRYIGMKCVVSL